MGNIYNIPPPILDHLAKWGDRISMARRLREIKQEDLAGMAGISRSTLIEVEKGSPFVSIGNYMATIWALDLLQDMPLPPITDIEEKLVSSGLPKRICDISRRTKR